MSQELGRYVVTQQQKRNLCIFNLYFKLTRIYESNSIVWLILGYTARGRSKLGFILGKCMMDVVIFFISKIDKQRFKVSFRRLTHPKKISTKLNFWVFSNKYQKHIDGYLEKKLKLKKIKFVKLYTHDFVR